MTFSDEKQEDEWIAKFCISKVQSDPELGAELRRAYLEKMEDMK